MANRLHRSAEIRNDDDGHFELIVSSTPNDATAAEKSDSGRLIVRQTFLDPQKRARGPVHRAHQLHRGGKTPRAPDTRTDRCRPEIREHAGCRRFPAVREMGEGLQAAQQCAAHVRP